MTERKPLSKRTRFEVFKRDGFKCQYCGATPPGALLHVDHIIAVANGGGNGKDNLITACQSCNLGKSAVPLASVPASLADKAAEVAERESQVRAYARTLQKQKNRIEAESWQVAATLEKCDSLKQYDRQRLQSIRMFLERLPFPMVMKAAESTAAKFKYNRYCMSGDFKYFCGACWGMIKGGSSGAR